MTVAPASASSPTDGAAPADVQGPPVRVAGAAPAPAWAQADAAPRGEAV